MSKRVLLFCQHLLGIGHYVRSLRIADALSAHGFHVTFVSGGMPVKHQQPRTERFEQLPPIRARDDTFADYLDAAGALVTESLKQQRAARLLAVYDSFAPDALIVEAFPFGRRMLRGELVPLLGRAHAQDKFIACSLRDILVARKAKRERETVDLIQQYFDAVLVHGDPRLIPLEETFGATDDIRAKMHYTGYVAAPAAGPVDPTGEVLVSAGGGVVGQRLLDLAVAARPLSSLRERTWRLVGGQALSSEQVAALRKSGAAPGVVIEHTLPDLSSRLRGCYLSVSQAGYNTIVEVIAARVPAVCVPFITESETEQALRCAKLAGAGYIQTVLPTASAQQLAAAIDRASSQPRQPLMDLDLRGTDATARIIAHALAP